jgi:hypothetical protein
MRGKLFVTRTSATGRATGARAYERVFWGRVAYRRLPAEVIRAAYVDAVFWAEEAQALTSR